MEMEEPARRPGHWRGVLADTLLLLFVAGLGVKAVVGTVGIRDFDPGDEWSFAQGAMAVPARGVPSVDWSPLYILWDYGLIRTGVLPQDVPFYSWACMAVLLPASVYLLARGLGAGRAAATVAGGVLPATTLIDINPLSFHLVASILALGTGLAARVPRAWAVAVIGLTLLTVTYVRPEFFYPLCLVVLAGAVGALWLRRAALGPVAVFVGGSAALVCALGSPRAEAGRPLIAFGQHYTMNRYLQGTRTVSELVVWDRCVSEDFNGATTVSGAWANNPDAFYWHLGTNARQLPEWLSAVAAPRLVLSRLRATYINPEPNWEHPKSVAQASRAFWLVLLAGWVGVVVGLRRWVRGDDGSSPLPVGVLVLALVGVPALGSSLLVFPRLHYAVPTVVLAVALAAAGARHLPRPWWARTRTTDRLVLAAVLVGLMLVVPNRANGWCVQSRFWGGQVIETVPTPIRASALAVRALDLRGEVVFLDVSSMASFAAGFGQVPVYPFSAKPGEDFLTFVRRTNVSVVIFDPNLRQMQPMLNDPAAQALADGRDSELFRVFPVEGYPTHRIAVRRDLLPPGK
jgi:hypothetical protein